MNRKSPLLIPLAYQHLNSYLLLFRHLINTVDNHIAINIIVEYSKTLRVDVFRDIILYFHYKTKQRLILHTLRHFAKYSTIILHAGNKSLQFSNSGFVPPFIIELQDFTLDFYFRQFWTDPRLAFTKRPGVETLSVGSEFIKNIWVPDTFFVNEKQSYFHIATTSNEFIRIHHSGSITRSIR